MNVLMLVMAMLMMFSIMTYAKLNKFRMNATLNYQFEKYMQFVERKYINEKAVALYNATHVQKKDGSDHSKNHNSSKLPIGILLEKSSPTDASIYISTRAVLKSLINDLYSDEDFYKTIVSKKPDFIDEIINDLAYAKDALPNNLRINKAKDLANLNLRDSDLNEAFYKMLKGASSPHKTEQQIELEGYPSLLEFISTQKGKKLRVFLASEPLLTVLFGATTADEIIRTREYFYSEISSGRMDSSDATQRFRTMFEGKVVPAPSRTLLDFSVTKTDPGKYR